MAASTDPARAPGAPDPDTTLDPGPSTPASGTQVHLRAGALTATIAQVGASLRELSVDGQAVALSHGDDEIAEYAEGQVLMPWPNRVAGGSYEFDGERNQLPLTEPEAGNAIHGLARWMAWDISQAGPHEARLSVVVHPQAGYPFRLEVTVAYALSGGGLTVTTTARNRRGRALPYGCGFHPYLTVGTGVVDDALLGIPAGIVLAVDDGGIPTGDRRAVGQTPCDFRVPRAIGDVQLDTVFGDLERDEAGRATVTLAAPDGGRAVGVWMDEAHPYVMAFTGDPLPEGRRRRSLGIEPMTCAPDALRSGDGLRVLRPGEQFTSRWGIDIG